MKTEVARVSSKENETLIFYSDGTYIGTHWDDDENYNRWIIDEDGNLMFKRSIGDKNWKPWENRLGENWYSAENVKLSILNHSIEEELSDDK